MTIDSEYVLVALALFIHPKIISILINAYVLSNKVITTIIMFLCINMSPK